MKTVSLTIDSKKVIAPKGGKVLWAALDNGIYIPNLCALHDASEPTASCRLCWVEVEGKSKPVTACTETVEPGMVVNIRGTAALRLARTALELLLASNVVDCARCPASGSCELQKIAAHLKVKLKTKRFRKLLRNLAVDSSSPEFIYDPNKCVLCGRCIWVCRQRLGIGVLGFAHRGFERRLTTFGDEPMAESGCRDCGECVAICPTGALCLKEQ
jgi:formate dehydrogenase major subunit/NADH-quinone oxidoreductase subunit G